MRQGPFVLIVYAVLIGLVIILFPAAMSGCSGKQNSSTTKRFEVVESFHPDGNTTIWLLKDTQTGRHYLTHDDGGFILVVEEK